MLSINVSADDDSVVTLNFEHSLVSLSKWESQTEKAFFKKEKWTADESGLYIRCMLLNEDAPPGLIDRLSEEQIEAITDYINAKQSATWFNEMPGSKKPTSEVVTSELIYYWLVQFKIPFEVQYWHLNRLMTLVKICGIKSTKPKKMSKSEQMAQMRALNAQRRAESGSAG